MAGKKLEYDVEVDSSGAVSDLKKLGEAGEKAGKQIADGFKDVGSKSEAAFDKVIGNLKQVTDESKRTIQAVEKIGDKMGEGFDPQATANLVNSLRKAGVEFDTIEGKADELAATMRELDGVRLDAANAGLTNARQGTDELTGSARGANSALANMVGNSAQDLGALGGVAGSAGVAIGQMAEYASDAALGGEALGASLASMAKVAGPIAALSAAMLALQGIMKLIRRDDGLTAEQVAAVSEALADQIGVLDEYQSAVSSAFGQGAADTIEVFTEAVLKSIEATKGDDFITGLETALGRLGVVRQQFGEIAAQSQQDQAAFLATLLNLHGVVGPLQTDLADYYAGLSQGTTATAEWARANPELAASFLKVSDALGEARRNNNAATQDFLDNQASINEGTKALVNAAIASAAAQAEATGTQFSWNDALKAYIQLQQQMLQIGGAITAASEAQAQATADTQQAMEDQTDAVADGIQAWMDYAASVQEATIDVGKVIAEVTDFAGAIETEFGKVDKVFDGLAFDVDFKPALNDALDDLSSFRPDFQTLADEWEDILSGRDVKIFGNVRADDDEFLELTAKVRELFQGGIVNEFEQGGVDAANTFAQSVAAQIAASTGLDIAEVYRIMGLPPDGSITTLIEPEVDAQHADQARAILDSLAGVEGGEAREARIHVALETGQIDGDVAYIASLLLAHEALGINVEPQLAAFTPAQIAQAQATIDGSGATVTVPVEPDTSGPLWGQLFPTPPDPVPVPVMLEAPNLGDVNKLINAVADQKRIADLKVTSDNAGAVDRILDTIAAQVRVAEIAAQANNVSVTDLTLDDLASQVRVAEIAAQATNVGTADAALDGVANQRRDARIYVVLPNAFTADQTLDQVAADRFADVYVRTHNTVTTTTVGGPSATPDAVGPLAAGFAADDVGINPLAGETVRTFGTPVSVAGPTVAPTVHNHVTIQAAVIGSRFDVERAVTKALRQARRLNGGRAA
jgi:hypothetical protein